MGKKSRKGESRAGAKARPKHGEGHIEHHAQGEPHHAHNSHHHNHHRRHGRHNSGHADPSPQQGSDPAPPVATVETQPLPRSSQTPSSLQSHLSPKQDSTNTSAPRVPTNIAVVAKETPSPSSTSPRSSQTPSPSPASPQPHLIQAQQSNNDDTAATKSSQGNEKQAKTTKLQTQIFNLRSQYDDTVKLLEKEERRLVTGGSSSSSDDDDIPELVSSSTERTSNSTLDPSPLHPVTAPSVVSVTSSSKELIMPRFTATEQNKVGAAAGAVADEKVVRSAAGVVKYSASSERTASKEENSLPSSVGELQFPVPFSYNEMVMRMDQLETERDDTARAIAELRAKLEHLKAAKAQEKDNEGAMALGRSLIAIHRMELRQHVTAMQKAKSRGLLKRSVVLLLEIGLVLLALRGLFYVVRIWDSDAIHAVVCAPVAAGTQITSDSGPLVPPYWVSDERYKDAVFRRLCRHWPRIELELHDEHLLVSVSRAGSSAPSSVSRHPATVAFVAENGLLSLIVDKDWHREIPVPWGAEMVRKMKTRTTAATLLLTTNNNNTTEPTSNSTAVELATNTAP